MVMLRAYRERLTASGPFQRLNCMLRLQKDRYQWQLQQGWVQKRLPPSQTTAVYTMHQVLDFIQCSTTSSGKDVLPCYSKGMKSSLMVQSLDYRKTLHPKDV